MSKVVPEPSRWPKFVACLILLLAGTQAFAHATLVLGTLTSEPAAPRANEPFTLMLKLVDPTEVPVEDAWVLAEFRSPNAPADVEVTSIRFDEGDAPGRYQARVTLPERGTYRLQLRDQTYRQEEARAELSFNVGRRTSLEARSFIFPPTATGPQSLRVWLLWLVGLPVLAAVVVTVMVLTGGKRSAPETDKFRSDERQT